MMPPGLSRRAQELAERGEAFVSATVVRARRPTSATAGDAALVLGDGTIEGFVGGDCAEHSVRAYALEALGSGEPILLRILPFGDGAGGSASDEAAREDGVVTVQNPCLSGGTIEVFLEPVMRAPRVLVEGDTPIVHALLRLGAELGLEMARAEGGEFEPRPGDLAVVVAGHGRDELPVLRRGLEAGVPYVGLVASRKRGDGVIGELRGDGVPNDLLERIETPAGLAIGARTPAEIALAILARIVAVRRGGERAAPAPPATAVDPICGMTVPAVESTPSTEHDGVTVYFCCEGCRSAFQAQREHAADPD
ncbi:MAG: xanthine dehydrogenase accessory factor [Gaiellaceae bacterium]|nr:xanthine dehydrogenase accessory factor [Gaiellaceae bacterium]